MAATAVVIMNGIIHDHEHPPTFRQLLDDLGQDVAGLLTDEFDLVTKEIRSELRLSLFVLGVLSVLSVAAVLTLSAAAVLGLSQVLEPPLAAAVVGASIAAFAVIFAANEDAVRFYARAGFGPRGITLSKALD